MSLRVCSRETSINLEGGGGAREDMCRETSAQSVIIRGLTLSVAQGPTMLIQHRL